MTSSEALINFLRDYITVFSTLIGLFFAFFLNTIQRRLETRTEVRNFKKLLAVELQLLQTRYIRSIGSYLDGHKEGDPIDVIWPVGHDYFTVFHTGAASLAKLDHATAVVVVDCYMHAKHLIDSFSKNNSLCEVYHQYSLQFSQTKDKLDEGKMIHYRASLAAYAQTLVASHRIFKEKLNIALEILSRSRPL